MFILDPNTTLNKVASYIKRLVKDVVEWWSSTIQGHIMVEWRGKNCYQDQVGFYRDLNKKRNGLSFEMYKLINE